VLSAIVDNVPLVAGAMGMYNFPMDHYFWEFLAYCAGTGGSILIIGSAAGVAVMGMENIDFIWYLRRISWLAMVGYLAGAATYIVQEEVGLLEARQEVVDARKVDPTSQEDVISYLTSLEFVSDISEGHLESIEYLHFIHFPDHKYNEVYMGYYYMTRDHGNESWEGELNKKGAEFEVLSAEQTRISILDKSFLLNSDGIVQEEILAPGDSVIIIKGRPVKINPGETIIK
jgi:hypothetical protein